MPYPSDLNRPAALLAASALWEHVGGGALVVACSGGPDSVALARAASELLADPDFTARFAKLPRLILWHLDHGLRANSADDARFVEELAESLRAEAVIERVDLGTRIAEHGGNAEAEARSERYGRLLAYIGDQHAWRAVTAHHLNDQAETVLHHLIRGTQLPGLRGIAPLYRGVVHRPWLALRRGEIIAYLDSRGQGYVTDPSNADTALTRNRLRHDVLPILEEINPSALEHIARLATMAREAVELRSARLDALDVEVFDANELAQWLPLLGYPRGYVVYRLQDGWVESGQLAAYALQALPQYSGTLSPAEQDALRDWAAEPDFALNIGNATVDLPQRELLTVSTQNEPDVLEVVLDQREVSINSLHVEVIGDPQAQWELFKQRDRHPWEDLRRFPDALARMCGGGSLEFAHGPQHSWECYLGEVNLPLRLRTWRVGERMTLAGGGSATIGDLFTNAKVPEVLRPLWCVLADADDNALWLPGLADGAAMRIDGAPQWLVRIETT